MDLGICLIRWESNFNTSEIGNLNADGSKDHGLFQINDKYWCVEGQVDGACGIDCKGSHTNMTKVLWINCL